MTGRPIARADQHSQRGANSTSGLIACGFNPVTHDLAECPDALALKRAAVLAAVQGQDPSLVLRHYVAHLEGVLLVLRPNEVQR